MILNAQTAAGFSANFDLFCAGESHLFYLDGCGIDAANGVNKYRKIVGIGCARSWQIDNNSKKSWADRIKELTSGKWQFVVASYELKNNILGCKSKNPSTHNWPNLLVVEPELICIFHLDDTIELIGDEVDLWLNNVLSFVPWDQSTLLSFQGTQCSIIREDYERTIQNIRTQIELGNMYEINFCFETKYLQFECSNPMKLFKALQSASPAPFSSYVCIENKHLISSSPERFMSRTGNALCSQPIKGTAARSHNQVKDFANKKALQSSIKERAEHIMIVDLVRNDLSQVAEPGSVTVSDLFGIYGYEHVYQMVSTIQASALPSLNWMDIFDKTFPMGSMTGAPKRIVLDFIDDFENTARGWYSGAVGYVEPNGDFDFSVIIRSLLYDRETNCASFAVGGAITYDSNSTDEFNESLLKGQSIQDLMQSLRTDL